VAHGPGQALPLASADDDALSVVAGTTPEGILPQVKLWRIQRLPKPERQARFARAALVALFRFNDAWLREPVKIPARDSQSTSSLESLSAAMESLTLSESRTSMQPCPWVDQDALLRYLRTPPSHFPADSGPRMAAVTIAALAARHLIAMTAHWHRVYPTVRGPAASSSRALVEYAAQNAAAPAASLPTLHEIAASLAMTALLSTSYPHGHDAFRAPERPHMRTCSVATWYQSVCRDLTEIAQDLRLLRSHAIAKWMPAMTGPSNEALRRVAGVHPYSPDDANDTLPLLPEPRLLYDGRLFHSLASELGVDGYPRKQKHGLLSLGLPFTHSSHYLTPAAEAALKSDEEAKTAFDYAWRLALELYNPQAMEAGYADIASGGLAADQRGDPRTPQAQLKSASRSLAAPSSASPAAAETVASSSVTPPRAAVDSLGLRDKFVDAMSDILTASMRPATIMSTHGSPPLPSSGSATVSDPARAGRASSMPTLPITQYRQEIISTVATHTVTIIKGDTGSGKSSQVPQYILDTSLAVANAGNAAVSSRRRASNYDAPVPVELWGDRKCRIYVTQPRRVAAVTLAKRVAEERETRLGDAGEHG
jgi:hypothetical protein